MIVLEPAIVAPDPNWSAHFMENEITRAVDATKIDLELQIDERPEGELAGRLIYDRDLFEAGTAERLAERWTRILAAIAADPALAVSSLAGATAAEERRQSVEWNATATERPTATVRDLISERSAAQPDAIAITDGGRTTTYAELEERLVADGPFGTQSTRTGKTVAISQLAAVTVATAVASELGLSPADVVLSAPERIHRAPLLALWAPLIAGARVVIPAAEEASIGARVTQLIKAEGVTLLHASPDDWAALIASGLRAGRSLRALSTGAELTQELADEILGRCSGLWNAYGTPETAGCATIGRIEPPAPVVIGRPISNTRVYVVDGDGRPAPIGAIGELLIAGDGVALEYIDRPELSAETFADAAIEGGPVFRTGDSGRWLADGILQFASPVTP